MSCESTRKRATCASVIASLSASPIGSSTSKCAWLGAHSLIKKKRETLFAAYEQILRTLRTQKFVSVALAAFAAFRCLERANRTRLHVSLVSKSHEKQRAARARLSICYCFVDTSRSSCLSSIRTRGWWPASDPPSSWFALANS